MKKTTPNKIRGVTHFLICLLLLALQSNTVHSQILPPPGTISPGGLLDTVFDRFGQKYVLGEIATSDAVRASYAASSSSAPGLAAGGPSHTALYTGCTPGYFRIYLEDGCGMDLWATNSDHLARLNVLCQVLTDMSNFIESPLTSSGQKVNLWIRSVHEGLGVSSPFYMIPYSTTKSGIVDNSLWLTINSGKDAFTNVAPPVYATGGSGGPGTVFFHAMAAFNLSAFTWHTDLSTAPTTAGEIDMYTVVLHEMMHCLGFMSLIDYNGRSLFDQYNVPPTPATYQYYTRYDQFLRTSPTGAKLITTGTGCDKYEAAFNSTLTLPGTLSPSGCTGYVTGETDATNCTTAVYYVNGSGPIPVYTPECFERGASLSHFEDECYVPSTFVMGSTAGAATNNQYFLMSNSAPNSSLGGYNATTNPGVMKRHPVAEERQVLCDIGYKVNTTFGVAGSTPSSPGPNLNRVDYGGSVCPGKRVVGIHDGISPAGAYSFHTTGTIPVTINGGSAGSILSNDLVDGVAMPAASGSFTCLEVVNGTGTLSASSGTATTPVTYTPGTGEFGIKLLRYIPVSSTGVEGSITYVYVFVGSEACSPSTCDLVTNGGFENVPAGSYGFFIPNEACWLPVNYVPMLMANDAPTGAYFNWHIPSNYYFQTDFVHPLSPSSNNHFVALYEAPDGTVSAHNWRTSSIHQQLTTSIIPGDYTISFWAIMSGGAIASADFSNEPAHLQFAVGNSFPLVGVGPSVSAGYLPSGFNELAEFSINSTVGDYEWHYYTYSFTYTGPTASTLFIQGAPWHDEPWPLRPSDMAMYAKVIGIDDISILPIASACTFYVPGARCVADAPFDLATTATVCSPGGTFSWPTLPVTGGVATTTTSSTFNPAAAYAASIATGGSGLIPVTYTYTVSGCVRLATTIIKVLPSPTPIGGPSMVCVGSTITLTDGVTGGTWSSSAVGIANPDATGVVTGVSVGSATITYATGISAGCMVAKDITVNATPGPITPLATTLICTPGTATVSCLPPGGIWSPDDPTIANIDAFGVITGTGSGVTRVTYTLPETGCYATHQVSVNLGAGPIMGPSEVCVFAEIFLSDAVPGGSWSSLYDSVATVDATGHVFAHSTGVTTITYALSTMCWVTKDITVNPIPVPFTGPSVLCAGETITLTAATPEGYFTINPGVPPKAYITMVSPGVAEVTGIMGGTAIVSYTLLEYVCPHVKIVTVNAAPAPIEGFPHVCEGEIITWTDATPAGSWSDDGSGAAEVDAYGNITGLSAGTTMITYTLPTGCYTVRMVAVYASPAPIDGPSSVCHTQSVTWTNTVSGGTWVLEPTMDPACVSLAITGPASVQITGLTAPCTATISYIMPGGCVTTKVITVNEIPAPITGPAMVCVGDVITLSDATAGGTWSDDDGLTDCGVDGSGNVMGCSSGIIMVSYTISTGCYRTRPVVVNPMPDPISGPSELCVDETVTFSDGVTGGSWSMIPPTGLPVAGFTAMTVSTADVIGLGSGTTTITFTLPGGCYVTKDITVNPTPDPITGPSEVCIGQTITLIETTTGGTWNDGGSSNADVNAAGIVTGTSAGTALISYTLGTGCQVTVEITVHPLPADITGTTSVTCTGSVTLSDATPGGSWSSSNEDVATIDPLTGVVSGHAAGTTVITYMLSTGCYKTVTFSVTPPAISGTAAMCTGSSTSLSGSPGGGTWSTTSTGISLSGSVTVTGITPGTAVVTYSTSATCYATKIVTVGAPITNDICQVLPFYTCDDVISYCPGMTLRVTGVTSATHVWSVTPTSGISLPVINSSGDFEFPLTPAPAAGTYTFTVVSNQYGCKDTTSIVIVVNSGNCYPCQNMRPCGSTGNAPYFKTITANVLNSSNITSGVKYYFIAKDARLDISPAAGSVFFMGYDVDLTVDSNITLDGIHMFSGRETFGRWKGITVRNTASVIAKLKLTNNTLIENASQAGVYVPGNPSGSSWAPSTGNVVESDGAIYNLNRAGMSIHDFLLPGVTVYPFVVKNSVFTCRDLCSYQKPGTSGAATDFYPFEWPSAATLKTPVSGGSANNPKYNIDAYPGILVYNFSVPNSCGLGVVNCGHTDSTTTPASIDSPVYYGLEIGDPNDSDKTNMFDTLVECATAANANVRFYNNIFRRTVHQGKGVHGSMDVTLLGTKKSVELLYGSYANTNNRFYNSYYGFYSSNCYNFISRRALFSSDVTELDENSTTVQNYGIRMVNTLAGHHIMEENVIRNMYGAIVEVVSSCLYNNCVIRINNNTITGLTSSGTNEAGDYGIRVLDQSDCDNPAGTLQIAGNNVSGTFWGIEVYGNSNHISSLKTYIYDDTVTIRTNSRASARTRFGIVCKQLKYAQAITRNRIMGDVSNGVNYNTWYPSPNSQGLFGYTGIHLFRVTNTIPVDVSCNLVRDLNIGFKFEHNNSVNWNHNIMRRNKYGMVLHAYYNDGTGTFYQGTIGTQGSACSPSDNVWYNDAATTGGWPSSGWASSLVKQTFVVGTAPATHSKLYVRNVTTGTDVTAPTNNGDADISSPPVSYGVAYAYSTSVDSACSGTMSSLTYCAEPRPGGYDDDQRDMKDMAGAMRSYTVFPNPGNGELTIRQNIPVDVKAVVKVMNSTGITVYSSDLTFANGAASLNIAGATPGVYMLVIRCENGENATFKVVIE